MLLVACTGGPSGDPVKPPVTETARPAIALTSPLAAEGRYGTEVFVTYDVTDFTLDAAGIDGDPVEGKGHVHAYLDGVSVGETAESSFTFTDVPSGEHTLEVRLATNDHDEQWEGSEVSMRTLVPLFSIVSPADGVEVASSHVPLELSLADFTVSAEAAFGEPAFGQGRYEVRVDDQIVDLGVDPAALEVSPLGEGSHTVTVQIVDASGAPLDPPVSDSLSVTIPVGTPVVSVDRLPYLDTHASATVPLAVTAANADLDYNLYVDGVLSGRAEGDSLLRHMAPGYHFVELRLMERNNELDVRDHVHLFVTSDRPDVTITTALEEPVVGPEMDLAITTENFTLDPDLGGTPLAGHGHWSVMLDGTEVAESGTEATHLTGLESGDHVLRVELRNNDRTPLDPPVYDEVLLTVD
ncbi:MAG: hypothetical protein Q8P41_14595 [Pseudomonadota bacterium]|nr:hypothetical protein [Pseudomonadota bacterium]